MGNLETVRAKLLNRRILDVLQAAGRALGEGWITARAIYAYLGSEFDSLTLGDVEEALRYLRDKGYVLVEVRDRSILDPGWLESRLAPKGADLLRQVIPPDPGVEDDRR